jgi:hypothetical protein
MPDNDSPQVETIRILASIQTTNEFILRGMTELKTEMGKVGEVVQAHAIVLQVHSTDIAVAKKDAEAARTKADDLASRVTDQEAPRSHWSTDNVKVILVAGSILYVLLELVKLLLTALLHPTAAPVVKAIVP